MFGLSKKSKPVVGLDIGSSAVKAVELKPSGKSYKVTAVGVEPIPPDSIVDGAIIDGTAVADAIKGLAGKYSSVLLANHGPVVSGDTLEAAVFAMEELEETAKLYLLLRGLNPRYLSPEQVADLTKVFGLTLPDTHDHP